MHVASSCSKWSKLPKNEKGSWTASGQCMWLACDMHATCNHMQVSLLSCRWFTSSRCPRTSWKSRMHEVSAPDLLENVRNLAEIGACTLIIPRRRLTRCRSRSAIEELISSNTKSPLDWSLLHACRSSRLACAWKRLHVEANRTG